MATLPYKKAAGIKFDYTEYEVEFTETIYVTGMIFQSTLSPILPFCGKQYRVCVRSYSFVMLYYKAIIKAAPYS